ncbi:apolipoprotein N-acyltransferase [Luteococcus sp.]|uniref:apolipoprotein N-acyltransferase n=1 Tax=Luteococcus sp. TaxID=1969402 RepID=UPI00373553C4
MSTASSTPMTARTRWVQRAQFLTSGAVLAMGWQSALLWPATLLGLAFLCRLLVSLEPRQPLRSAAALGWWAGLGQGVVALSWVYVIGWYVVPPLLALMACWTALLALVVHATHRWTRSPWLLAGVTACAWSLVEYGAARIPFGGFGWLRLGYAMVDSPLSGLLPLAGVAGLGWATALLGSLLGLVASRHPRALPILSWLALTASLLLASGAGGRVAPGEVVATAPVHVGMVQGNLDGSGGPEAMGYARSVTDNHVSQTVALMARSRAGIDPVPDFVLWPENSTDVDPTRDAQTRELITRASSVAGRPILVGAVMAGPGEDERQTSALWWTPEGRMEARYDKRNLVPFGEWIPLRRQLLPVLPVLEQVGAQSVPGTTPGVMAVELPDGRPLVLGDVVCFELAWDRTVHDTVRHGAQVLVSQSNLGTYTGTAQPRQQYTITRARAMEMRREVVVATTNSYSGLVLPDGSVEGLTVPRTAAAQTFTVPMRQGLTPAMRLAGPLEAVAAALAAASALAGLGWSPRRRGRATG